MSETPTVRNERVVVVGGAGTLGRAIVEAFAIAGATVFAADVDEGAAERITEGLPGHGHRSFHVDVRYPAEVDGLADACWEAGPASSVVYAPGVNYTDYLVDTDWAMHRLLMAVNLDGAFYTAKSFGRRMLSDRVAGSLTFIASTAGKRGEPGGSVYCATKFGLIGMVESFAGEVATAGLRVNAVCPGNVDGPMLEQLAEWVAEREGQSSVEVMKSFTEASASGRLIQPREIAEVCVWLASEGASAITGASIVVDAGTLSR